MTGVRLAERYGERALAALGPRERARIEALPAARRPWELLYRLEPQLYDRLVAAERLHPDILRWLPEHAGHAVEVAAGTGRLTRVLEPRCRTLVALEPAAPMRAILAARVGAVVCAGAFEALPVRDGWAELTVSCASYDPSMGDAPLEEMERITAPGSLVVLVWPPRDRTLLDRRGYAYESFDGEMAMEFGSRDEALEIVSIFYPHAVGDVDGPRVPYDALGVNPPRDLCWKRP